MERFQVLHGLEGPWLDHDPFGPWRRGCNLLRRCFDQLRPGFVRRGSYFRYSCCGVDLVSWFGEFPNFIIIYGFVGVFVVSSGF